MTTRSAKSLLDQLAKTSDSTGSSQTVLGQSARASLLLKLIKDGTIPPPPKAFVSELQELAAQRKKQPKQPDLRDRVNSLTKHLQALAQAAPEQRAAKAKVEEIPCSKTQLTTDDLPNNGRAHAGLSAGDSQMVSLEDQHPAVIKQHLEKLDPKVSKTQLRALPGDVARRVSLLAWKKTQDRSG